MIGSSADTGSQSPTLSVVARSVAFAALLLALVGTYAERWGLDAWPSRFLNESASGVVRVGDTAPVFQTVDLKGAAVSLDDYRGRVVVINFWATWCPPCRVEMPELDAYQAELGDRIAILGVDMGEPPGAIVPFVREYGLRFPILLDETGAIAASYGVAGLPTSLILDRSGVVRERVTGAMTRDTLARRVERLL
jgi:thiol-disulfide isomerase/thioredoxin